MAEDAKPGHKFWRGLQPPSEKPHVFPEATHDVAVRNTCGFSAFTFVETHAEILPGYQSLVIEVPYSADSRSKTLYSLESN